MRLWHVVEAAKALQCASIQAAEVHPLHMHNRVRDRGRERPSSLMHSL